MYEIPFGQKVHIGLVKQSQYIISTMITTSLLIFYTDYIGLENSAIFGFAIFVYGFWNAINDPLFGYYSDMRVSKGKMRMPFIKLGMPIMLVGFLMMIFVPRGWADWDIFFLLLFGLIVFDLGKALSMVNYDAYCITLANNPDERSKLNMIVSYVGIIPGALIGIVPPYFLTGDFVYIEILIFFLVLVLSFFFISLFSLSRLEEPPEMYLVIPEQDRFDTSGRKKNAFTLKEGFQQTLTSKPFLILILFRFIVFFYHGIYYTNIIYMMKWVVPISGTIALLVAGAGGLMINIMYPIIIKLRKKHGTIKIIQWGLFAGIPGYIIMFFAIDFWSLTIGYMISTIAFSGLFFEPVLIGDVADDDFINTGTQKQGMFVSIYGFFNTLSYSIVIFIFTLGLEFFQYNGELEVQSDFTIFGLRILASLLPIIAIILSAIILNFFPLKGERYKKLRSQIKEYYEKKNEI